ncbi:hypothetical protein H5410_004130 [Solanum commersonii]|uniref:F-box associated domain-containing protein n=1 Tax=Solanum commersonii TaxID=4109 RepID=A0A9J6B6I6_SOLCO|nr:hypothetical protein H5410_004130 [Solanum commersonii]
MKTFTHLIVLLKEVRSLSPPCGLQTPLLGLTLGELGNCLYLSDYSNNHCIDIWWMKEYGIAESWTKKRILTDSIQADICGDKFIPILLWKDGEILMQRDFGTQLVSYKPKENKFTKVKVYDGTGATSYTPSFYPLKNVIGECFQVPYAFSKIELGVFGGLIIAHIKRIMDLPMSIFCCTIIFIQRYSLLNFDPLFVDMHHKRSFNFPKIFHSINDDVQLLLEFKDDDSDPLNRDTMLIPRSHLPTPTLSK